MSTLSRGIVVTLIAVVACGGAKPQTISNRVASSDAGVARFEDNDDDGIESFDACDNAPEDFDGFPDPDNDRDGVLDANDKCPNDAEDIDQVDDTDGCPE